MTGWDSSQGFYVDTNALRTQQILATGGNAYGPQFGPAEPASYYYVAEHFPCGCSEEDTDGIDCGHAEINFPAHEPEERITELDVEGDTE